MLFSQGATMLLAVVTVSLVPRYLGPQTYGALTFAYTFVLLLTSIAFLGSNPFLVKVIARDPANMGAYLFNGLAMKVLLGSFLTLVAIAVSRLAGYPQQTALIILVLCLGMILGALNDILAAGLQGVERMGRLALWSGVQQYVTTALAVGLLLAHKGVVIYVLVTVVGGLIPLLANGYHLWPATRGARRLDVRLWRAIAVGGMPFFLWGAILLVYGSIDIVMLQGMTNSDVVGWYGLAYRWVGIPVVLPAILATVTLPSLSSLASVDKARFALIVNRALQIVLLVAIPMAVGTALIASDIIGTMHYPVGFDRSALLMRVLAIHIPIVALDMILAVALTANDRQKAWLAVGCVAVVFNPTLNLFAIPFTTHRFGDGAIGASVVTVATELVMLVGAIYLRPPGVLDRQTLSVGLRCLGAAAIMVPAVLLAAALPLPLKILIGVVTFGAGAVALRLVSPRQAWSVVTTKGRPLLGRAPRAGVPVVAD
jgi:O-antigen/teichoic acid export membrane protein